MVLLDAPSMPTVTLPPGAPWALYAEAMAVPVVVYALWVFRHALRRLGHPAEVQCADCAAARTDVSAMRAETAATLSKLHAATRQIADLQHADSQVLEGVAEGVKEGTRTLGEVKTTVTLIDRDSFRREPTR